MQTESVQHLGGTLERDPRTLPSNGDGRQEDRNESVLPPWQPVARVTGDLQNELPVPAFMEQAADRRPFHRQATKDERARREPDVLLFAFTVLANDLDRLDLAKTPFRNDQTGQPLPEQVSRARRL